MAICNTAVSVCGFDITVQSDAAATNLVADVQGYFAQPTAPVTQNLFAAVNSNATLAMGQSFRATGVLSLGTGIYQVDFDRNITNCSYVAGPGDPGVGGGNAGFVAVTQRSGDVNGLFIRTFDTVGTGLARNFFVHVMCPPGPSVP